MKAAARRILQFKPADYFVLTIAAIPFYYVLRMVFAATFFPMELEVREGVSWLHVLAQSQGISIYDHSQVAYFGSHGAVDHLLKTLVHLAIPPLPSQAVVRTFVFLLPPSLLWMAYEATRGLKRFHLAAALIGAAIIYVGMANTRSYNLLVGRPDPPTLFFMALQGAMAARFYYDQRAGWLGQILHAVFMSLSFFTVWRILPATAAIWLIGAVSIAQGGWRIPMRFAGVSAATFSAVFLVLLFAAFMGSPHLFYTHFVGMMFAVAEVGTHGTWQVFPDELLFDNNVRLAVFPPLGLLFIAMFFVDHRKDKVPLLGFVLATTCYVLFSYAFHQNKLGGGMQYFSPYILVCWLALLLFVGAVRRADWPKFGVIGLATYALVIPTWMQISVQTDDLESNYESVQTFRKQLEELDSKGEVMSEAYHLYKAELGDSIIDSGDGLDYIEKNNNFFGPTYSETGQKFLSRVESGVYKYFLTGAIEHPRTNDYLKANYTPIARAPAYSQMNARGGCISPINCPILWQKK